MPKFIPGLKLCRLFYQKEIRPILEKEFPRLRYSAALIGWGSEVLGFDTPMSRDQLIDSTDVLQQLRLLRRLGMALYQ